MKRLLLPGAMSVTALAASADVANADSDPFHKRGLGSST